MVSGSVLAVLLLAAPVGFLAHASLHHLDSSEKVLRVGGVFVLCGGGAGGLSTEVCGFADRVCLGGDRHMWPSLWHCRCWRGLSPRT